MISCMEFIPAYNEIFRFLEAEGGRPALQEFWNWYSDRCLAGMKQLVEQHGLRGCWLHWKQTLAEEAADCTLTLDEDRGEFRIDMDHCPSKGMLLEFDRFYPIHPDYCHHCAVIFRRVLEPLGYEYLIDQSDVEHSKCTIIVRKKNGASHADR